MRRPASAAAGRGARPRTGAPRPALVLTVPSETSFLGLVREVTRKMAETAGFDQGTLDELELLYDEGDELWHARLDHLSPVDLNWNDDPDPNACSPAECGNPEEPQEDDPDGCEASGSIIE